MTTASDIEAQAAEWLVKRDAGTLSEQQLADFEAWLASDPRARAAYLRLEHAWHRADALRRLRPLDGAVDQDLLARSPFEPLPIDESPAADEASETHEPETTRTAARKRRWFAPVLAAAAALAVVAVGAVAWIQHERRGWHEYSTDFGGLERIVLEDGSFVSLNTNSAIRVQLTPAVRHIVLERGEALFKVAHDPTRPFDVEAGSTVVRAVGTEFSVRVREGSGSRAGQKDVEVLVKEGRVAIDPPRITEPQKKERPVALPPTTPTLSAGEAVRITAQRVQVQRVAEAEVDRKLSWTEGRLWFERQTLKDVVAEFNRYNRRQMVIDDPAIENLRIGGGFVATDLESFLAALERTVGVRAFPSPNDEQVIRLVGTRDHDE